MRCCTAARLFYNQGLHATGIDRLVSEAGVIGMTLYDHFGFKDATLDRRYTRYMNNLGDAMAQCGRVDALQAVAEHCTWLRERSTHECIVVEAIGEFANFIPPDARWTFENAG